MSAIGIDGKLNILSALYQPLRFSFPLIVKGENWSPDDINISIASETEYANLGLPYPLGLRQIQYDIKDLHNGYMEVTAFSPSIIREPVISLLLYVEWPKGKIRYEFTLLMDLPLEKNKQLPQQHKIHLIKKHIPAPEKAIKATNKPDIQIVEEDMTENAVSLAVQEKPEILPLKISNSHDVIPLRTVKRDPLIVWDKPYKRYRIQNGDTLSTIAMTFRGTVKLPLHKYIAAIIAQNPQYFASGINRIATGDILQIPNPNNVRSNRKNKAIEKTLKQQQKTFRYHVQYGDILSLLAQKLRGKQKIPLRKYIQQIIAANPGVLNKKGDNLKPGMVLNIPNLSYQRHLADKSIADLTAKKNIEKLKSKKTRKEPKVTAKPEQQKEARQETHIQQEDNSVFSLLSKPKAADQYWLSLLSERKQADTANVPLSVFNQPAVVIDTTNFRNRQIAFNDKQKRLAEQERLQQFKSLQSSYRKLTQQMVRQQQQYEQQNHNLKVWLIAVCVFFVAALFLLYQYLQSNMRKRIDWIIKMERSQYNAASINQHSDPDQTIKAYPRHTATEPVPSSEQQNMPEKKGFLHALREKIGAILPHGQSHNVATEGNSDDHFIMDHNLENTDLSFLDEHDHTDHIELDIEDDDEILEHASKDELDFTFDEVEEEPHEALSESGEEAFQSSSYASTYQLNALELAEIESSQNTSAEKATPEDEHSEAFDLMSLTHEDEEVPDYIRLANEPVHQPVLPDDIVHLNDVDYEHLEYTDDVEGEIEKEIRRQIEKLEQNQPAPASAEQESEALPVMDFDLTEEDSPEKKEQLSDLIAYVQQEIEEEERKLSQQQENNPGNNEIQFTLADKELQDNKSIEESIEIPEADAEQEEAVEISHDAISGDAASYSKSQSPLEIQHEQALAEEDTELVLTEPEEGTLSQEDFDVNDFMVEEQDVDEENIDNALSSLVIDHYEPPNPRPGPPVEEPGELIDFQSTIIDAELDFDDKDSPLEELEEQKLKTDLNENVVSIHEIQPKKKKLKEEKKEEIADLVLDFFKEKDQS